MPEKASRRIPMGLVGLAAGSLSAAVLAAPVYASAAPEGTARATTVTALGFNSTDWTYRQVPPGAEPAFFARNFDDAAWPSGQEGFGTANGPCSWNRPADVHTPWAVNTDILVRHWLHIPRDAQRVRVQGTVDNDAQVYVNGHLLQSVRSGDCRPGAIDVVVPRTLLDCCDLLAIRGHDAGVATYLNVRVTYVKVP